MAFRATRRDELQLLRGRLALGMATYRRVRGLAVLSVRVHAPPGGPELPALDTGVERVLIERIRTCLEQVDTVAAVGPYQFCVLIERADEGPFAVHAADQIVAAIRSRALDSAEEWRASIGISVYPEDGADVDELMRCAAEAAEAAELGGGDLFGFYSQPLNEAASRRAVVERALVGAVEREEFHVCFQPQIDARDGSLVGVETLARLRHAKLGAISPVEFIPVLEANGEIAALGAWVLAVACRQGADWARAGRPVRVSVNVSAVQLKAPGFEDRVFDALRTSGLDPSLLELELTESVLVDNPAVIRQTLDTLRSSGVRIAVDDFGTGYASLAYIRQFPLDTLKIDRQFVRGLPLDPEACAITSAIVALARSLNLEMVAEGVEHEAEEEFLHSQGCFVVQGFLHARPMIASDLEAWRQRRPWA